MPYPSNYVEKETKSNIPSSMIKTRKKVQSWMRWKLKNGF
jgi:hypothetical protein